MTKKCNRIKKIAVLLEKSSGRFKTLDNYELFEYN